MPGTTLKTLDSSNVTNASKLKIERSTAKNFYNSVAYQFEEDVLDSGKFNNLLITADTDSRARITGVGVRQLNIDSLGLRSSLNGANIAATSTSRRLDKYKFGAEYIRGLTVNLQTAFDLEIGDVVILDLDSLNITDIKNGGTRDGATRLFQLDNKSFNLRTGQTSFDLIDTNFTQDARFCLISPASFVNVGTSTTVFEITASYNTTAFGGNEFKKWESFIGSTIKVRSVDSATVGTAVLKSLTGNVVEVETSLGFTPSVGYIMEVNNYALAQPLSAIKDVYCFMSNATFADGEIQYQML